MADMGWTEHYAAEEAASYGYWGEAIESEHDGIVYTENVVFDLRDALLASLPMIEGINHIATDPVAFDIRAALARVGGRDRS